MSLRHVAAVDGLTYSYTEVTCRAACRPCASRTARAVLQPDVCGWGLAATYRTSCNRNLRRLLERR